METICSYYLIFFYTTIKTKIILWGKIINVMRFLVVFLDLKLEKIMKIGSYFCEMFLFELLKHYNSLYYCKAITIQKESHEIYVDIT